jgi:hypothetical protein
MIPLLTLVAKIFGKEKKTHKNIGEQGDTTMMKRFEITGGDGGAYGPEFGPVVGMEVAEIHGPQNDYLLLSLSPPMSIDDRSVECMIVSPRYQGDTLKKLRQKGCTVGVFLVQEGMQDEVKTGITKDNVTYWAVGGCKPIK